MKIQSTNEQICTYLKQQISEGALVQGQQLNLNQIAESLGVSVTPVRDAVNLLIYEGFIDKVGNRMFIHKIPEEERRMLEEAMVAQICTGFQICLEMGLREKLIEELETILKNQEEAGDFDHTKDEFNFDTAFVRCTGNIFLYRNVVKDFEYHNDLMYIAYQIHREKQRIKSLAEHKAIIQLIKDKRDNEFRDMMMRHYQDVVIDN